VARRPASGAATSGRLRAGSRALPRSTWRAGGASGAARAAAPNQARTARLPAERQPAGLTVHDSTRHAGKPEPDATMAAGPPATSADAGPARALTREAVSELDEAASDGPPNICVGVAAQATAHALSGLTQQELSQRASFPPLTMPPHYNDHPLIDALPATKSVSSTRALRDSPRPAGTRAFRRRCVETETRRGSACVASWSTGLQSRTSAAAGDRRRGGGDDRA
jgi:hypothetical protein